MIQASCFVHADLSRTGKSKFFDSFFCKLKQCKCIMTIAAIIAITALVQTEKQVV
jgi:hypothetical protein